MVVTQEGGPLLILCLPGHQDILLLELCAIGVHRQWRVIGHLLLQFLLLLTLTLLLLCGAFLIHSLILPKVGGFLIILSLVLGPNINQSPTSKSQNACHLTQSGQPTFPVAR